MSYGYLTLTQRKSKKTNFFFFVIVIVREIKLKENSIYLIFVMFALDYKINSKSLDKILIFSKNKIKDCINFKKNIIVLASSFSSLIGKVAVVFVVVVVVVVY